LIDLYIRLIEKHFEIVTLGSGYNHPRVIEKLIYLGLFLHKHKRTDKEKIVINKIDELNNKYLELNKDCFKLKKEKANVMGPDEFQLCLEIHELENDIFSYGRNYLRDSKYLIQKEITKKDWDGFIKQITYCKDIEYKTNRTF
jgi:hypothetical protein